ncbi:MULTISPECIES: cob(I)yrinic acid a,c-diamide adenosyltransferase [unclassified Halorhabdus]|uniref:cob(I)yrinic acid a,c-diamide adenosyltransferase n=1 Tax=unclassified Halorhabdus TaxID=2621901 RepID=UPI0023DC2F37|nr:MULTISPECIES: cob(I)yrinic acid a,c-diamide adenosyltransferase [unclassified Halorhabdus]WEL17729.1 Cob(I)alamin adenosyltransferase [Halorhabdus sp. SVX81]WEL21607.1 Cob(I)alamin adenosyltransferase [Halorhabdus sp. BNX81]
MSLYTGRGDEGKTDLHSGDRVSKTSPRIEAYGTIDELNALIGTIHPTEHDDVAEVLRSVQNDLHVVQAEFATPAATDDDPLIETEHVAQLEAWIDGFDADLPTLESFVLPGGGDGASALHHARTVCRRAERRAIALAETADDGVRKPPLVYLNRLSDLLFVLARTLNDRAGGTEPTPTY